MKILYQYANTINLNADEGDIVNERNFLRALQSFAKVHYAKNEMDFNPQDFDIAYIRANEQMFDYCKGIKRIWMASPYNERCYREADYIATFTESLAQSLRDGEVIRGVNPDGRKWDKVIVVNQVLDTSFNRYAKLINIGGYPVIGSFGRIADTTFPHLLFASIPKLKEEFPRLKILLGITNNKSSFDIPDYKCIEMKTFPHNEVAGAISSCDIISINQKGIEWDICGNLKTVEAAIMGVPVIIAESKARRENLGKNYPFFIPMEYFTPPITNLKVEMYVHLVKKILTLKEQQINFIMNKVKENARKYTLENQRVQLKKLFKSL